MKKLILATLVSVFSLVAVSSAHACDGMKGHAKGDKADQSDSQPANAKKDGKAGTKADQKS
ncbi:MAG: hypothetical protein ABUL77_03080 [Bacteroidota bacterium]